MERGDDQGACRVLIKPRVRPLGANPEQAISASFEYLLGFERFGP
jgi:hypothetical protein